MRTLDSLLCLPWRLPALGVALCITACADAPQPRDGSSDLVGSDVVALDGSWQPGAEPTSDDLDGPSDDPGPDPAGAALIGGCSYRCLDGCTRPGLVVGYRLDTHEAILPVGMTEEQAFASGGTCRLWLPLDTPVVLEARPRLGVAFVEWLNSAHPTLNWQPCPCEGSQDPSCQFTVSERTYCGAVYRAERP